MLGLRCTPVYPRLAADWAALPLLYGAVVGTDAVQDAATHGKGSGHAPAVVAGALLAACSRAQVVGWAVSVGREGGGPDLLRPCLCRGEEGAWSAPAATPRCTVPCWLCCCIDDRHV